MVLFCFFKEKKIHVINVFQNEDHEGFVRDERAAKTNSKSDKNPHTYTWNPPPTRTPRSLSILRRSHNFNSNPRSLTELFTIVRMKTRNTAFPTLGWNETEIRIRFSKGNPRVLIEKRRSSRINNSSIFYFIYYIYINTI
jgi:hypothetical protein